MTTTVTAGNTASFQIGPFDTITLSSANGVGRLALTSAAPKLVADQALGLQNGTFGPWGAPMSVVLTVSQGSAGYDVASNSLAPQQVVAALSPDRGGVTSVMLVGDSNTSFGWDQGPTCTGIVDNGNGTATISWGGSHNWTVGQAITVNNSSSKSLNVFNAPVVAMTNSGTFNVTYTLGGRPSPVTTASPVSSTQSLHMLRYSCLGFPVWLQALQSKPLGFVLAAAGGADSSQALTMYNDALSEARTAKVSDIVLMIGTNDIFARGWDYDTTKASIKALVDQIVSTACGARLWWLTILPMGSGGTAWTSGKQTVLNRINRWIWRYAGEVGAFPIDSWGAQQNGLTVVDGGAANPDNTANFLGSDVTHTTNLGALALARSLDSAFRQATAAPPLAFQGRHSAIQNQGNALTNSQFTGTGGTSTPGSGTITLSSGGIPTSWTLEITSGSGTLTTTQPARTVAADGDISGNNLQVVPSVSAVTWRLIQSSLQSAVTAGEIREASVPVTITSAAGLTGIELIVFGTKSSGGNENFGFTSTSIAITGAFTGVIRAPRWTVPSGLTSLSWFLRFTQTGTPAGTFIIGKPNFELIE